MTLTFNDEFNGTTLPDTLGSGWKTVFPDNLRTLGSDGTAYKATRASVADMSSGMHCYGVDWQEDRITFYFDSHQMGSVATPDSLKVPMYFIANLAVGGWAGAPDATTSWPAEYRIDSVHIWQDAAAFVGKRVNGMAARELLTGNDGNDTIYGGGNDTVLSSAGNDRVYTGAGNDRINAGPGNDYIDGGAGVDTMIGGLGNTAFKGLGNARELGFTSMDAVLSHAVANGARTILTADNGEVITLQNVAKTALTAHDFLF